MYKQRCQRLFQKATKEAHVDLYRLKLEDGWLEHQFFGRQQFLHFFKKFEFCGKSSQHQIEPVYKQNADVIATAKNVFIYKLNGKIRLFSATKLTFAVNFKIKFSTHENVLNCHFC